MPEIGKKIPYFFRKFLKLREEITKNSEEFRVNSLFFFGNSGNWKKNDSKIIKNPLFFQEIPEFQDKICQKILKKLKIENSLFFSGNWIRKRTEIPEIGGK